MNREREAFDAGRLVGFEDGLAELEALPVGPSTIAVGRMLDETGEPKVVLRVGSLLVSLSADAAHYLATALRVEAAAADWYQQPEQRPDA